MNQSRTNNRRPETTGLTMENASPLLLVMNTYIAWLIALIVVIVLAASYLWIISPKVATISEKNETYLPNKESTLKDLKLVEQKLIQLRQEYATIQSTRQGSLDKLFAVIPNQPDFPSLFVQAEYLANKRGLKLQSIDISRPADPALSERRVTAGVQTGSAEQLLDILPRNVASLSITLKLGPGSYEDLKAYLDDLEKNLRLFDIQTLGFETIDPKTKKSSGFNLTLKTYYRSASAKAVSSTANQTASSTNQ